MHMIKKYNYMIVITILILVIASLWSYYEFWYLAGIRAQALELLLIEQDFLDKLGLSPEQILPASIETLNELILLKNVALEMLSLCNTDCESCITWSGDQCERLETLVNELELHISNLQGHINKHNNSKL
jgi:NifB/MoaA-like Fe-S oxidoreductase